MVDLETRPVKYQPAVPRNPQPRKKGREIYCDLDQLDSYDRWLSVCGNDEVPDFGAELIRQGLVVAYRYRGKPSSLDYARLEDQAKAKKLGLWQLQFEQPWTFRARIKVYPQPSYNNY